MPLTLELLFQQIQQNDEKHEDAHHRLRGDLAVAETKLERVVASLAGNTAKVEELKVTPVDIAKLRFTPSIVMLILTTVITIAGGMWASTYGLRSDVRDILTRMDAQSKAEEVSLKLQDERATALRDSIEAMKRRQELQQYEIQELKETILKQGVKR